MTQAAAPTAYSREQATVYDDKRFTGPAGQAIHRAEIRPLMAALSQVAPGSKVLEVGCGTGRLLVETRAAGYRVDGVDASPEMLEMLRGKLGAEATDVELKVGEGAKLPVPDNSYPLVYSIRVLNQMASREYALEAVADMVRAAQPGGYVLVEFVNDYRPRWGAAKKPTVRLKPREVAQRGRASSAEVEAYLGAFFLSMQAYRVVPAALVGMLSAVDGLLSRAFPRLCARSYVLLRKAGSA